MSKCRRCKKEVDKNTIMFGYCEACQKELSGVQCIYCKSKNIIYIMGKTAICEDCGEFQENTH